MKVIEKRERFIQSIDGERVMPGDVCCFRAKGLICIGIYKKFGKRGAIEFESILDNKSKFALMPNGIDNLVVLPYMKDFLGKRGEVK